MKTNTKSKHLLAVFALLMVLALALTGCSGGTGTQSAGDTAPADTADGTAAPTPAASGDKEEILVGYVAPFTGPLSVFTVSTRWVEDLAIAEINADGGIFIEEYGKKLPVRIIYGDSESDPIKASEVADKLVTGDGVDLLIGAWTPDTTAPVSAIAERRQIPAIMSNSPKGAWLESGPYEWATGIFFDFELALVDYISAWDKVDTNRKVGYVFDNEVDGVLLSGMLNDMLPDAGYEIFDPGRFPKGTNDYSNLISQLRSAEIDVLVGNMQTPDFAVFWKQVQQSGWMPKVFLMGKAVHFYTDILALGEGEGIMSEIHWDRTFPYTSSLLNLDCATLADMWESDHPDVQVPSTLGYDICVLEVMNDALTRAGTLDRTAVRDAILDTDMEGIYGRISFDKELNTCTVPCITIQWVKDDTWGYTARVVATDTYPIIPAQDPMVMPGSN